MSPLPTRTTIREKCVRHIVDRLNRAEAATDPYPHFWQTEILPAEIYQELLERLPSTDQLAPATSHHYGTDGAANRFSLTLQQQSLTHLDPTAQAFWLGVRDAIGAPEVKRAVFAKLSSGLSLRFGVPEEEVSDLEAYPKPVLFRETSGYFIKPHPDTRRKVVTMQIALPRDDSQRELGTSMYRLSLSPSALARQPRGFAEVKRNPFVPNSVFAFSVINTLRLRSWHGCEALPADAGERNSLLSVYYRDAADGDADLLAEQYDIPKAA